MKEIQIRPRIAEHDLQTKIRNTKRILKKDKVKVAIIFKGRELSHPEFGESIIDRVITDLQDCSKVYSRVTKDRQMFVILEKI